MVSTTFRGFPVVAEFLFESPELFYRNRQQNLCEELATLRREGGSLPVKRVELTWQEDEYKRCEPCETGGETPTPCPHLIPHPR
jgi:hypothetical protein